MQSNSPLQVTNENISLPIADKTNSNNGIDSHERGGNLESLRDDMDTHGENVIDNNCENSNSNDDHTLKIVKLGAGGDD